MPTGNPALNARTFAALPRVADPSRAMTIQGTVNKALIMLALLLLPAVWVWQQYFATGTPQTIMPWLYIGIFGGLVVALVTVFKRQWSPVTAPLYSVLEGFAIGAISSVFEARFPGIVIQAVALTFGTLLALLLIYKARIIKVTAKFRLGVVAATGGIVIIYVLTIVLGFFGIHIPLIYGSGPIGILFSLFVVTIAALNLVLDFDFIENGAASGAPKYMEWYAAFGLMVTLIWLYLEILRLLAKISSRR
jgi:uncharacterized YccA/Bax inhibitor family protein